MLTGKLVKIRALETSDEDLILKWRRGQDEKCKFLGLVGGDLLIGKSDLFYTNTSKNLIFEEISGTPIGAIRLDNMKWNERNLAIFLGLGEKEYQGKEHPQEALKLIIGYLFREENFNKVFTYILDYDRYSLELFEKLGFKREATLKEHLFYEGGYHDVYIYGLLREEFA